MKKPQIRQKIAVYNFLTIGGRNFKQSVTVESAYIKIEYFRELVMIRFNETPQFFILKDLCATYGPTLHNIIR